MKISRIKKILGATGLGVVTLGGISTGIVAATFGAMFTVEDLSVIIAGDDRKLGNFTAMPDDLTIIEHVKDNVPTISLNGIAVQKGSVYVNTAGNGRATIVPVTGSVQYSGSVEVTFTTTARRLVSDDLLVSTITGSFYSTLPTSDVLLKTLATMVDSEDALCNPNLRINQLQVVNIRKEQGMDGVGHGEVTPLPQSNVYDYSNPSNFVTITFNYSTTPTSLTDIITDTDLDVMVDTVTADDVLDAIWRNSIDEHNLWKANITPNDLSVTLNGDGTATISCTDPSLYSGTVIVNWGMQHRMTTSEAIATRSLGTFQQSPTIDDAWLRLMSVENPGNISSTNELLNAIKACSTTVLTPTTGVDASTMVITITESSTRFVSGSSLTINFTLDERISLNGLVKVTFIGDIADLSDANILAAFGALNPDVDTNELEVVTSTVIDDSVSGGLGATKSNSNSEVSTSDMIKPKAASTKYKGDAINVTFNLAMTPYTLTANEVNITDAGVATLKNDDATRALLRTKTSIIVPKAINAINIRQLANSTGYDTNVFANLRSLDTSLLDGSGGTSTVTFNVRFFSTEIYGFPSLAYLSLGAGIIKINGSFTYHKIPASGFVYRNSLTNLPTTFYQSSKGGWALLQTQSSGVRQPINGLGYGNIGDMAELAGVSALTIGMHYVLGGTDTTASSFTEVDYTNLTPWNDGGYNCAEFSSYDGTGVTPYLKKVTLNPLVTQLTDGCFATPLQSLEELDFSNLNLTLVKNSSISGDGTIIRGPMNLKTLTFGNGNITIEASACTYLPNLKKLTFGNGNKIFRTGAFGQSMFSGSPTGVIDFGNGNVDIQNSGGFGTGQRGLGLIKFGDGDINIGGTSSSDGNPVFSNSSVSSVIFGKGTKTFYGTLFSGCERLSSIEWGEGDVAIPGNQSNGLGFAGVPIRNFDFTNVVSLGNSQKDATTFSAGLTQVTSITVGPKTFTGDYFNASGSKPNPVLWDVYAKNLPAPTANLIDFIPNANSTHEIVIHVDSQSCVAAWEAAFPRSAYYRVVVG